MDGFNGFTELKNALMQLKNFLTYMKMSMLQH